MIAPVAKPRHPQSETIVKISQIRDGAQIARADALESGGKTAAKTSTGVSVTTEKLSISELSSRLSDLETRLSDPAPFDLAKVEGIKQAIREGKLEINAGKIADRLLESVKDLLGK
jgi:negative regulator of flagellin synthesis FlgM